MIAVYGCFRLFAQSRLAERVKECVKLTLVMCVDPVWCKDGSERTDGVVGRHAEPIGIRGASTKEGGKVSGGWGRASEGWERDKDDTLKERLPERERQK